MVVFRRRLIYWLIKEYARKWKKTILLGFIVGLLGFYGLFVLLQHIQINSPKIQHQTIGIVGAYTTDSLPPPILEKLSRGLTKVDEHGTVVPDLSTAWQVKDNGKTYIFLIHQGLFFSDGTPVNADTIQYNFSDAKVEKPNNQTLIFKLKDTYTPFLISVSRPILKKGLVGVGKYKIKHIDLNGSFLRSLELQSTENRDQTIVYKFYPTADSVKIAFLLGEITQATQVRDEDFRNTKFSDFKNARVEKTIDYNQLVTLFFNTQDNYLSSRDVRTGLSYALPDSFSQGKRSYSFFPPPLWSFSPQYDYVQDLPHAKLLTADLKTASSSGSIILDIKTLPKYTEVAKLIAKSWQEIGIQSVVETVDSVPSDFQIFLGDFSVPKDPDQYTLWHTGQESNITKYENKRIDKLLEDGRKITNMTERKKIYDDLQKYLLADMPAAFLYFPYQYTITRK